MNSQNAFVARTTKMRTLLAFSFLVALFGVTQCSAQNLQAGISVSLPLVSSAMAVPDADKEDALIVTVTEDGDIYLGVEPIEPDAVADKIKHAVAFRAEKKVYIKADARAHYSDVQKVLTAMRKAGVQTPVLLMAQREPLQPGALASPKGFEVLAGPQMDSELRPTLVQVLSAGQQSSTLKVNDASVSSSDLPSVLARLTKSGAVVVQVSADGSLPFSDIAQVIDISRSTGATVALVTPRT
jgi:biopolymer transport protein ExbD